MEICGRLDKGTKVNVEVNWVLFLSNEPYIQLSCVEPYEMNFILNPISIV